MIGWRWISMIGSPTLALPRVLVFRRLLLVPLESRRVRHISSTALSLDILELHDSSPCCSIQGLLCLAANQVQSSSVQKLTKRFIMESGIGNYLLDIADRSRSDRGGLGWRDGPSIFGWSSLVSRRGMGRSGLGAYCSVRQARRNSITVSLVVS